MKQREAPLERFLGRIDPALGPFGVLGLEVREYSAREINEAIRLRMLQVDRHPQRDSVEADEVRLAIHVSAAQVLDPAIRAAMLDHIRSEGDGADLSVMDDGWISTLVLQTVARSGGWNANAKQRLASIGHAHGLSASAMSEALTRMKPTVRGGGASGDERNEHAVSVAAEEPERHRGALIVASVFLLGASFVLAIALSVVTVSRLSGTERIASGTTREQEQAEERTTERVDSTAAAERESQPVVMEGEGRRLVESLRRARQADGDAAALAGVIVSTTAFLERSWPHLDGATIGVLPLEFAESLTALHQIDAAAARQTITRLGKPISAWERVGAPDMQEMIARAWASGLFARLGGLGLASDLARERDRIIALGYRGYRGYGGEFRGEFPNSFNDGVVLSLETALDRVLQRRGEGEGFERAWRLWMATLGEIERWDRGVAEGMRLASASRILRMRPGPSESPALARALDEVVRRINFSRNEQRAHERLLSWFDDQTISADDLSLLTMRLHSDGLISGLGMEMVLGSGATQSDRLVVRDAYARRFGLPQAGILDEFVQRLRSVGDEIRRTMTGRDAGDALARGVVYSMLSSAASVYWSGDESGARTMLAQAEAAMAELRTLSFSTENKIDARRFTRRSLQPDGRWAVEYLSVRNPEEHMNLLATLRSRGGPEGPADALVLADAALRGPHIARRRLAQDVLSNFSDNPFVLNAVLVSMSSNVARQQDVHDLLQTITISTLPELESEEWMRTARASVALRLFEMLSDDRHGTVDRLQQKLAMNYAMLAGASGVSGLAHQIASDDAEDDGPGMLVGRGNVSDVAWMLCDVWLRGARRIIGGAWSPFSYDEMQRRASARRNADVGAIEQFVGAQSSLCEVLGYLVAAERRDRADGVRALLDRARHERGEARHIFEQIEALERAMFGLWVIRVERGGTGGEG
ncbi:MAG: hypothetical protein EA380_06665 [Phycisphaeraceae bacterium]|nr:MAG: hypothetical protein EA380_06665 [Phycisphaeraceae bacterium]